MTLDIGLAARLIAGLRSHTPDAPAWDAAGIAAALREVGGTPGAAFAAAALAAEDASLAKPSPAAFRNHWPQNAGVAGPRETANMRCHRHPLSVVPCPQCAAERGSTPPPQTCTEYVEQRARLKREREEARLVAASWQPRHTPTPTEELDRVRQQLPVAAEEETQ